MDDSCKANKKIQDTVIQEISVSCVKKTAARGVLSETPRAAAVFIL